MQELITKDQRAPEKCCLILPIIYTDGFGINKMCEGQFKGIYMTLVNLSAQDHRQASTKSILCYLPQGANLLEALRIVMIKPLLQLECGIKIYFEGLRQSIWCYGSMFAEQKPQLVAVATATVHNSCPKK
jgi:hypothetical protein